MDDEDDHELLYDDMNINEVSTNLNSTSTQMMRFQNTVERYDSVDTFHMNDSDEERDDEKEIFKVKMPGAPNINSLKREIRQKDELIKDLHKSLKMKDDIINQLRNELEQKDKLLERAIQSKMRSLEHLDSLLSGGKGTNAPNETVTLLRRKSSKKLNQ